MAVQRGATDRDGCFWQGEWTTAATHLGESARLELGSADFGRSHAALLRLDAYQGGKAAVQERWTHFHVAHTPGPWPSAGDRLMAIAGAEAWVAVGEHTKAAALYPQIAEASAHGTLIAWDDLRLLATAAAVSAAAGGHWELAEAHFTEALLQADTLPHRLEQADAPPCHAGDGWPRPLQVTWCRWARTWIAATAGSPGYQSR
ncbi:MAG TPA: hypothetical protein VFQ77_15070 [Pseudonocardiaceae bacterium]|nr:hypothetical protein [Pseudonocardiaceae bacterium]